MRLTQKITWIMLIAVGLVLPALETAQAQDGECTCLWTPVTRDGKVVNGWSYTAGLDCDHDGLTNAEEDLNVDCDPLGGSSESNESHWRKEDTDGDGIRDNYEKNKCVIDAARPNPFVSTSKKKNITVNDCNGDGEINANDDDSDGDGISDKEENCITDNGGQWVMAPNTFSSACTTTERYAFNPYLWQELNPYDWDSDKDKLPDGDNPATEADDRDYCPQNATGGNRFTSTAFPTINVTCMKNICRSSVLTALDDDFDADLDGRYDKMEEADSKNCNTSTAVYSKESNPYDDDTDDDGLKDGDDPCPRKNDLRCLAICLQGGTAYNVADEEEVSRRDEGFDTDLDGVLDADEDTNGNCAYDAAGLRETNWENADTDGDAALGTSGALGVGNDLLDKCPHIAPVPGDETTSYPGCLLNYCSADIPARLRFTIQAGRDTDGDGINDDVENPAGHCRQGTKPLELDPLDADTDDDGILDGVDPCPHAAGVTVCPEICPIQTADHPLWDNLDTDGDGLKNSQEDSDGNCLVGQFETSPFLVSTKGRLLANGQIISDKYDSCGNPAVQAQWLGYDTDGDGLTNGEEDANGDCDVDEFETDPFVTDTDGDGFDDRFDSCGSSAVHNEWLDYDSDGDGLKNGEEDSDGDCSRDPFESDPFDPDTDKDGLDDAEDACPYSASAVCLTRCTQDRYNDAAAATRDSDGDGLKDFEEDSNKNCVYFGIFVTMIDGPEETEPFDTNPFLRDSDGDGIPDRVDGCQNAAPGFSGSVSLPVTGEEIACAREQCLQAVGRDPGEHKDSDRDLIPDRIEDLNGDCELTTGAAGETQETDRFNPDTDFDGIPDGVEDKDRDGKFDDNETDPRNPDSDFDGIPDGTEDRNHNGRIDFGESDPKDVDTDHDGITDNVEDRNLNGIWDGGQTTSVGPCVADGNGGSPESSTYLVDSDRDGLKDDVEDKNKNGIFTNIGQFFSRIVGGEEVPPVIEGDISTSAEFGESNPCDSDTDHDGLFDGQEDADGNGIMDITKGETSPISPNTFGEPDSSRLERRLGISGCTLIPD